MTNNEKVKQAITNNMASIYSALEQVGATLPEKKNLENVTTSIESLIEKEFNNILESIDYVDTLLYGYPLNTDYSYKDNIKYWILVHINGGKDENT